MSIGSAAVRVAQLTRTAYSLRRFELLARGGKARRPLCLVYGNCQAEPIRALLAGIPEFAERYEAVCIPAVHLIRAPQVAKLQRVLRAASLIVAQPIRDGYRGLPLGTDEMIALAGRDCRVIRFPSLYYDALYPFQVNVHLDGRQAVQAPLTMYHDLRTLCAAAKGLKASDTVRWIRQGEPPPSALRAIAENAAAAIRERESMTDIRALESIIKPPQGSIRSFFTVNHPAGFVLRQIAWSVHDILGITRENDTHSDNEPLGVFRTPLEQPVINALGLASAPAPDWIIKGKRRPIEDVVRLHLDWYRLHPDLVQAGLREHAERIAGLRLL